MILQVQYAPTTKVSFLPSSTEALLIGCPVCGRPTKIRRQLIGEEVACSHCRGTYVVNEKRDGSKTARSTTAARQPEAKKPPRRLAPLQPPHPRNELLQPNKRAPSNARRAAIATKPRDETYAHLAADLIAAGYRVIRASPPSDTHRAGAAASGGDEAAILKRLFLRDEDFEFFADSFPYQRRRGRD